jgi:DNA polymerase III epsilon subunit-like protein
MFYKVTSKITTTKNDKCTWAQRVTMLLFLDTETTGLPLARGINAIDKKGIWPDIVSIAWSIYDDGKLCKKAYSLIRPDGWKISEDSIKIHGITMDYALEHGRPLVDVLAELTLDLNTVSTVVAHNMEFDKNVIFNAYKWRLGVSPPWAANEICTMEKSKGELKIPNPYPKYGAYKPPKLSELYKDTFGVEPAGQHNSQSDVETMCAIYWKRWA